MGQQGFDGWHKGVDQNGIHGFVDFGIVLAVHGQRAQVLGAQIGQTADRARRTVSDGIGQLALVTHQNLQIAMIGQQSGGVFG